MPATAVVEQATREVEATFELARGHFGHVPNIVAQNAASVALR